MKVAALFDLDGTLVSLNTGLAWYAHERRMGRVSAARLVRRAARAGAYLCGAIDIETLARCAVSELTGLVEADVRAEQERWYDADVRPTIRVGAAALLDTHRRLGHTLALLTGASPYVAAAAARDLDIPEVVSTGLEVRDGRFTGRVDGPVCLGAGKLIAARAWAATQGIDLGQSWYYADDADDLPLLAAVGHPVAVHPSRRLHREAARRGFAVQSLSGPAPF